MIVRLRFSKQGKVAWISHRDVARCFDRAIRRSRIELEYSQGFSPRPKISFGLALPTGAQSVAEYLDFSVAAGFDFVVSELARTLSSKLPSGIEVVAAEIPDDQKTSLQALTTCCDWRYHISDLPESALMSGVEKFLLASSVVVPRTRKGKEGVADIRPGVFSLEVDQSSNDDGSLVLRARLATLENGVRPIELLCALGLDPLSASLARLAQYKGDASNPLEILSIAPDYLAPLVNV